MESKEKLLLMIINGYNGITDNLSVSFELGWSRKKTSGVATKLHSIGCIEIYNSNDGLHGKIYKVCEGAIEILKSKTH